MKIEGGRPNAEALGTRRVNQASVDQSTKTGRRAVSSGDSVQRSSNAHLVSKTVSAVTAAPSGRRNKIDAARKAIEAGRVGDDPYSLADKMIDSLLERTGSQAAARETDVHDDA
jgi:flagellar biosynthesis anti-sigma factor FlgM